MASFSAYGGARQQCVEAEAISYRFGEELLLDDVDVI